METYQYMLGTRTHDLHVERFESLMLSRLHPFSSLDPGVLAVHRKGEVRTMERALLCSKARTLWGTLAVQDTQIQFTYALQVTGPDRTTQESHGGNGGWFAGEPVLLDAGPGFCHITATEFVAMSEEQIASMATRRAIPRSDLPPTVSYSITRVLRDLRDMEPVTLDDGHVVRATRRKRSTRIVEKLRQLVLFLEDSTEPTVQISVISGGSAG